MLFLAFCGNSTHSNNIGFILNNLPPSQQHIYLLQYTKRRTLGKFSRRVFLLRLFFSLHRKQRTTERASDYFLVLGLVIVSLSAFEQATGHHTILTQFTLWATPTLRASLTLHRFTATRKTKQNSTKFVHLFFEGFSIAMKQHTGKKRLLFSQTDRNE